MTSFGKTPFFNLPLTVTLKLFGLVSNKHWLAKTCATWLVPIPNAMAPNAPCVEVWLSPQTIVMPGCVTPNSGAITWTIPLYLWPNAYNVILFFLQFSESCSNCFLDNSSFIGWSWSRVGVLWSAVATIWSGLNTEIPRSSNSLKACGLVTSWIKCWSMYNICGPFSMVLTTCESQTLSNNVFPIYLPQKR